MITIITNTPWWVYLIFIFLVIRGAQALRPHTAPLLRLLVVPLIFISWSLYSLRMRYGLSLNNLGIWALFACMGALFGLVFFYHHMRVDKKHMVVHIDGSVYPLIFYMLFFIIKYSIGFTFATSPETYHQFSLWIVDICASGFITGIFSGRFIYILQKYNAD